MGKRRRKFVIPSLLKTEQIEVEVDVKPNNAPPCTDSKSSISSNNILFTCLGCGKLGRLVKTTVSVEVSTQTWDESSDPEIKSEDSEMLGVLGSLDREIVADPINGDGTANLNSNPATSTASPIIIVSSGKILSYRCHLLVSFMFHTPCAQCHYSLIPPVSDDECSDEDDCLGESGGEEEISSSEDDMMLGLTDLSDSSEDDEKNYLQQPTSPNLSKQILPQPSNSPVSLKSGSRRRSTRKKRAKTTPYQEQSSPHSPSHSSGGISSKGDDSTETFKVDNATNEQSFQCKIRGCPVVKPSEQDLFEHVRIDHSDRKHQCNVCPTAFKLKIELNRHSTAHSKDKPFECDECGKGFKWKRSLSYHKLTHSDMPFRVRKCGLKMPRENLEDHVKIAHPEYEHKCSRCPKTFKFNAALIVHERVHSGDKPFKYLGTYCYFRNPRSSSRRNLTSRISNLTDGPRCTVIEVTFAPYIL
eukprot:sb/3464381/